MSGIAWPADPVDTDSDGIPDTPAYAARDVRQMHPWQGRSDSRPFGALSGPVAGPTLANLLTIVGSTWTLAPHSGVIDGEASSLAGAYTYAFPLAQTGTIPDASTSHSRVDTIAIQLSDPGEGDGTPVMSVDPVYSAGIADGSNTVPAAPARSVVYVRIAVPQAGHGSPTILWVCPSTVAAGGIAPVPAGVRPPNPYLGQYVDDATSGLQRWNGSAWIPVAPSSITKLSNSAGTFNTSAGADHLITSYDQGRTVASGDVSYAAGVLTVGTAGVYRWDGSVQLPGGSTNVVYLRVYQNGSPIRDGQDTATVGSHTQVFSAGGLIKVSAGDTLQLSVVSIDAGLTGITPVTFSLERRA